MFSKCFLVIEFCIVSVHQIYTKVHTSFLADLCITSNIPGSSHLFFLQDQGTFSKKMNNIDIDCKRDDFG